MPGWGASSFLWSQSSFTGGITTTQARFHPPGGTGPEAASFPERMRRERRCLGWGVAFGRRVDFDVLCIKWLTKTSKRQLVIDDHNQNGKRIWNAPRLPIDLPCPASAGPIHAHFFAQPPNRNCPRTPTAGPDLAYPTLPIKCLPIGNF